MKHRTRTCVLLEAKSSSVLFRAAVFHLVECNTRSTPVKSIQKVWHANATQPSTYVCEAVSYWLFCPIVTYVLSSRKVKKYSVFRNSTDVTILNDGSPTENNSIHFIVDRTMSERVQDKANTRGE